MRLLILILFLIIFLTVAFIQNSSPRLPKPLPTPFPTAQTTSDATTVTYKNTDYNIYMQKIADTRRLTLIPNFNERKSSGAIMEEYGCRYGANAGFYTAEGKPLGLFFTDGNLINSKVHTSQLFNGFVFGNSRGLFDIRSSVPKSKENSLDFYFQSGPLFTPETKLTIRSDERARRILIGKTNQGMFYFLALVEVDNVNSGPLLADLPAIIHRYNETQLTTNNLSSEAGSGSAGQLTTLLNLDGGSASAFYSQDGVQISELTPIGSFLCGKE